MGLKEKLAQKKKEREAIDAMLAGTGAMELNSRNIDDVFFACVASPTTLPSRMEEVNLYDQVLILMKYISDEAIDSYVSDEVIASRQEELREKFKKEKAYLADFKDAKPILFDKSKLKENDKKIRFMIGQLKLVHEGQLVLRAENSSIKYDGFEWNKEDISLMQLYYLAIASKITYELHPVDKFASFRDRTVLPTLSPYDPDFPAWWKEHKAEWADPE